MILFLNIHLKVLNGRLEQNFKYLYDSGNFGTNSNAIFRDLRIEQIVVKSI